MSQTSSAVAGWYLYFIWITLCGSHSPQNPFRRKGSVLVYEEANAAELVKRYDICGAYHQVNVQKIASLRFDMQSPVFAMYLVFAHKNCIRVFRITL